MVCDKDILQLFFGDLN